MPRPAELNDRQRAYLLAIFETDQAVEAEMHELPYRPFQPRPKASEWRWLECSEPVPLIGKPASKLYAAIKKASKIDQGTGSTFDALAARGLVEVSTRGPNSYPYLRITPAGRRLARSWTGKPACKAPPPGTLREWHWRALAKAYAAGDAGLEGEYRNYAHIGERTWQRLLEYRWGALVEERGTGEYRDHRQVRRMHITAGGRVLYEREWARYREMYPDVEGPQPQRAGATPRG
jgi:hypothetical protein